MPDPAEFKLSAGADVRSSKCLILLKLSAKPATLLQRMTRRPVNKEYGIQTPQNRNFVGHWPNRDWNTIA